MLKVKRLMHPNDPIITGAPPFRPAAGAENNLIRAAYIWHYLEKAGVPDVRGVAYYQRECHRRRHQTALSGPCAAGRADVAMPGSGVAHALRRRGRRGYNIWDSNELLWALHANGPGQDIDIMRRCWSNPIDPIIRAGERGFLSRGIIDVFNDENREFPSDREAVQEVTKKFGASLAAKKKV